MTKIWTDNKEHTEGWTQTVHTSLQLDIYHSGLIKSTIRQVCDNYSFNSKHFHFVRCSGEIENSHFQKKLGKGMVFLCLNWLKIRLS